MIDPALIIREEDWVNHGTDEGNFDPRMVALATLAQLQTVSEHGWFSRW